MPVFCLFDFLTYEKNYHYYCGFLGANEFSLSINVCLLKNMDLNLLIKNIMSVWVSVESFVMDKVAWLESLLNDYDSIVKLVSNL